VVGKAIETYDVGSMPFPGDFERFALGASHLDAKPPNDLARDFERRIVESFIDKLQVGIDVPNYPQFRDMNRMFLEIMEGVEKTTGGYVETGILSVRSGNTDIPEVLAISNNSREIYKRNMGKFRVKICITGPYTLSSFFAYRDPQIYRRLGELLEKIVEGNIFDNKYGSVSILVVDEPVFGMFDDPNMDVGSMGRENLLRAWEGICHKACQKKVGTCIHLHSTTDELFWQVDSLRIVESHVDDPLYSDKRTKRLLESSGKLLKASISITIFDTLIEKLLLSRIGRTRDSDETGEIGEVWRQIQGGKLRPEMFVESIGTMRKRLKQIIQRFGSERVPYAGSECGLRSFPTYECAIECLRRVSKAIKTVNPP